MLRRVVCYKLTDDSQVPTASIIRVMSAPRDEGSKHLFLPDYTAQYARRVIFI
jgi:hypothetical protein